MGKEQEENDPNRKDRKSQFPQLPPHTGDDVNPNPGDPLRRLNWEVEDT